MIAFRSFFRASRPLPAPAMQAQPFPAVDALLEMSSALVFGLKMLNDEVELAGHAERVAELADRLARNHGVSAELRAVLRQAALLHEVGMIGVPRELVRKGAPLTEEELERVHLQAEIGAAIVRATHGELAATLVRHQYDDEATLRERLGVESDAYLLLGFLRAADVADVIAHQPQQGLQFVTPDAGTPSLPNAAKTYAAAMAA
ncbi:MAG TPA: HD domain-containing phosphohydrolase [Longimicrobium sp.]|nr:HD domain-containing phosphohydrolase [Longimicrobium sp.]